MRSKKPSLFPKKQNSHSPLKTCCPAPTAVIDIGTNTIRLLIGCISDGGIIRVASDRVVTRLGKDILKTGRLDPNSIEKSISSIVKFKGLCEKYNVQKIIAIGTSALREAKNSNEFLEDVKKTTGLNIEIISGEKEAELTFRGIIGDDALFGSAYLRASMIVDIGGGSTEWIIYKKARGEGQRVNRQKNSELKMGSIPIGAVKLFETFIKHDPPAPEELQDMRNYIFDEFSQAFEKNSLKDYLHCSLFLIATGGTATTIAAIDMGIDGYDTNKIHRHKISLPTLKTIYERLTAVSADKRCKIKGLEIERTDIIIPGTIILLTLLEVLGVKEIIISDYGLLEGALISYHVL